MSELRRSASYDWNFRFWRTLDKGGSKWAALGTDGDRLVFEREVEAMVRHSIPGQLDSLRRAYDQCQRLDRLLEGLAAAAANQDEFLDSDGVMAQLECTIGSITPDGWIFPTPKPLPIAQHDLVTFVQEAKVIALMTVWTFVKAFPNFLDSLPAEVRIALKVDLFEVVIAELISTLCGTTPVLPKERRL